jgi:hypothetical protein
MTQIWRYDYEWVAAGIIAAYLASKLTPAQQEVSPVISFFDPMYVDDANRIIVEVPNVETTPECPGNFKGTCKVTVKSQWTQAAGQQDLKDHRLRTKWTRDVLMSNTLAGDLTAIANQAPVEGVDYVGGGGISFDFIQPKRHFETEMREAWAYSTVAFQFNAVTPQ